MVDVRRLARETVAAPYYRARPRETMRYSWSKVVFARHRLSGDAALARLGFDALSARSGLENWQDDLTQMFSRIEDANAVDRLDQGALSLDGALLQYGLVRSLRPQVIVETGVASGVSTAFICAALIENGSGRLISIDLPPAPVDLDDGAQFDWSDRGVGWAIPESIRAAMGSRHELVLEDVKTSLPRVLEDLGEIDCFIHDDLHTPDHMRWEFDQVWPRIRSGGVMASDDVNHAWIDFATSVGLGQEALTTTQRFGAIRKP